MDAGVDCCGIHAPGALADPPLKRPPSRRRWSRTALRRNAWRRRRILQAETRMNREIIMKPVAPPIRIALHFARFTSTLRVDGPRTR
jgi:hypothetical protein